RRLLGRHRGRTALLDPPARSGGDGRAGPAPDGRLPLAGLLSRREAGPRAPGRPPARGALERRAGDAGGRGGRERARALPRARHLGRPREDVQALTARLRARARDTRGAAGRAPVRVLERLGRGRGQGVRLPGLLVQPVGRAGRRAGRAPRSRRRGARPPPAVKPRRGRGGRAAEKEKGGPPNASRPSPQEGAGLPLAGQLLALHIGPDLLRHLGGADRRAAEDRLGRILAALEVDRVAPERLLPLRHSASLLRQWWSGRAFSGVFLPHGRGPRKRKYHPWGVFPEGKYPGGVWRSGASRVSASGTRASRRARTSGAVP